MIPTAGAAHLDHVNRKLSEPRRQQNQFLGRPRRSGHCTEVVTEYPGNESELFLATDRAHHRAELPVELRRAEKIGIRIADLSDPGTPGVHLSQQRPAPKGVVHHLPLQSHGDQSTSALPRCMGDRPVTRRTTPNWRRIYRSDTIARGVA